MRGFLKFVTRGRTSASLVAAVSLLLPPFSFVSGGIVGLVTLRYGAGDGATILALASAAAGAVTLSLLGTIDPVIVFLTFTGGPVLVLAVLLRATSSQGIALAGAGAMGGAALCAVHLLSADPVAWWRAALERMVLDVPADPAASADPQALARVEELLDVLAPLMTSLPIGAVVAVMLVLLLARWWHALLDNPGGFAREFRALRLDRRVAYAALGVTVLALFAREFGNGLSAELFQLVVVMYTMQGVAMVHGVVAARAASAGWLVSMYVLLFLLPPMAILVLSVAGFSDTWLDYRRRWGRRT